MLVLLGIGFLAGVITAISPCVLPVLPIVFAGGASGDNKRRPLAIVAGLVLSFALSVLFATWLLDRLNLRKDLLRDIGIGLLFLIAVMLAVPRLGELLERPLARLSRRRSGDLGGGFVLGLSLGVVFTPCAGPVLGAISVNASTFHFGWRTILITFAYALGAAGPMLLIAMGGQRATHRLKLFRARAREVRLVLAAVIALATVGILFNLDNDLQKWLGDYTSALQRHTEQTSYVQKKLTSIVPQRKSASGKAPADAASGPALAYYGVAPDFAGISHWLNTPGEKPLTLASLHGKVVLVDFWTYSCINCLRTLPYLEAWYKRYAADGLVVVGVHTPEFTFEHDLSNVRQATHDLGVRYPVALDNSYTTWTAYSNQYWPAEYLIDRGGHVRDAHFGEGQYTDTENAIRKLLAEPSKPLPAPLDLADHTPVGLQTPESYLGYDRLARYAGSPLKANRLASYELPASLAQNELAYGGTWRLDAQRIVSGPGARLRLHFVARKVHLVLGGHGRVDVFVAGKQLPSVTVTEDKLYTLVSSPTLEDKLLELRFSPGVQAYAFTFG